MTPALNWYKVAMLTSFEDLVLYILIIWGTKPNVVSNAAAIPITYQYIPSMVFYFPPSLTSRSINLYPSISPKIPSFTANSSNLSTWSALSEVE